jgi:hypothetical protein
MSAPLTEAHIRSSPLQMETFAHADNGSMEAVSPVKGFVLEDDLEAGPEPKY